ncbi:transcriptional regulator with XRE-family HTH domain [Spinactinospora alkalitolerans]|uniref:Transcriptional regulator with XRE-family HTH domain n=1 Tax=Spinactinospora alkalitolerans TaxID=687207 RepID=A0A852U1K5_9ACTN|nr:helix-turn-helix transcriptional regulator [Spinactinospora alkalitolerans]NYE49415.1 transcriptional regulator with XRE-family HTH domain [Spinactinospora alkalitolerans]
MSRKLGSTVRARRLRRELKQLRNATGLSTDQAGERAGMSGPTISRIESGKRGVSVDETERLLDLYDVPLTRQRELLDLAERANELGWWQAYAGQITDATQTEIALEEEATRITNFEVVLVPGLLQTAEYARDIIRTSNFSDQPRDVEAKVAARMARQSVLTRPSAPELQVILDEAALHRFREAQIMARQLRQLVDAASRPNITVRLIPFSAGQHASAEGSFVLHEFGEDPAIVLLEGKTADLFLEEPHEVAAYQDAAKRLLQVALDPSESVELIDRVSKELQ